MLVMAAEIDDVDRNIAWLRGMRERLGWSTPTAASRAKGIAAEIDEPLQLSQQSVSAFENGKVKSSPRWLGFMQLAMLDELEHRKLDHGELFDLRLTPSSARYFSSLRKRILDLRSWEEFLPEERQEELRRQRLGLDVVDDEDDADTIEIASIDEGYGMGATFIDEHTLTIEKRRFSRTWVRQFTDSPP